MNRLLKALSAVLVLAAVTATAQQGPDPNSPRFKGVLALEKLLASEGDAPLREFIAEKVAPSLREKHGDDRLLELLRHTREAFAGAEVRGAMPAGPFAAQVVLSAPARDGRESITFDLEPEPPHRFVEIELVDPDATPPEPLDDEEMAREIAAYLDELAASDQFSGTVLFARGDEVLLRKAYGLASQRYGVPNRPDTKLNLGSMNKMFTGVAIAQLVEKGKLSFDDRVIDHLPDYPNKEVAEKVTIHHLLTHTSGLGSYWNDKYEAAWKTIRTLDDLLPTFVDDPLAFEPGSRFGYSNAGPVVLGLILERVTGQSYYDYVREHVYEPAGMKDTDCYEMDRPVPNLAIGYTHYDYEGNRSPGPRRNNLYQHSIKGGPAGGGFSTVDDLLRFSLALQRHELLGPEMTATVIEGKTEMGPGFAYAYLFGDHSEGGHRYHGHNGGAPGISAEFSFYPELGYTLAVLSNYDGGAQAPAQFIRKLLSRLPAR